MLYSESLPIMHEMLKSGKKLIYVIVDPGSSCAVRVVMMIGRERMSWQYLIRSDLMASKLAPKTACIAKILGDIPFFKEAHFYFLESQFRENVTVQYGALIGIICALRSNETLLREGRRGGSDKLDSLPYEIIEMSTRIKGEILKSFAPGIKDLGDASDAAAKLILENYFYDTNYESNVSGQVNTVNVLERLRENENARQNEAKKKKSKTDDISDVVCYDSHIFFAITSLFNGNSLPEMKY
jgi:hypothetical protein